MARGKPAKQYGIVAFLDVLGTKGSWKRKPEKRLKQWSNFQKSVDTTFRNRVKHPNSYISKYFRLRVSKISFSDTMIITVTTTRRKSKRELELLGAADILISLMTDALDMGIYFRGCISLGNFYYSKSQLIIGPAVDEAAEYYQMPNWVGISAAPSAHYGLNKIETAIKQTYYYVRYDIPMKNGLERDGWALNWPHSDMHTQDATRLRSLMLSKKLSKINDISISMKYRNTLAFYKYAISKTEEWHKKVRDKTRES